MTYNVFSGTLKPAQSHLILLASIKFLRKKQQQMLCTPLVESSDVPTNFGHQMLLTIT